MTNLMPNEPVDGGQYEELRWLTDVYGQVQKLRIANGNRVFASSEGLDTNRPEPFVSGLVGRLEAIEKDIFGQMRDVVCDHPAWPWLNEVKGIGPTIATKILGLIGDIERFDNVAKLWSFAGYGLKPNPETGVPERQRPQKGEKLTYNRRLKTAVYLAGDSFIKSRSPYRWLYDSAKHRYRIAKQIKPLRDAVGGENIPNRETPEGKKAWDALIRKVNKEGGAKNDEIVWSDGHVDNAARRVMVKIFLSHLWEVWREAEGFSTRPPYAIEYLNHSTYHNPWSFVGKGDLPNEPAA